ncbi:AraC family transcriptional regulator [Thalassospira sp. UBA1131]|uniref:AraC family transcriptional regulator n=1 Tax=Thalassospira sp. UBA1131 TaxID=1947672 RepID=UPI0025CE9344|nr:AraC family transcriptional regulator [Thalassospira sp. UBA1131]
MTTQDRPDLVRLAAALAPKEGYNHQPIKGLRVLRSESVLHNVPVLYQPGVVFVCQGSKRGVRDGEVFVYDEAHYLAVSVPVPFRMESDASPERPLLAIYLDFDMRLVAELIDTLERYGDAPATLPEAESLISSKIDAQMQDVLRRLLQVLQNPVETAALGDGLLRELYFRILSGPQGAKMIAALTQRGNAERILRSLGYVRENFTKPLTIADLAQQAGMSIPSYHAHFRRLLGSSPIQYIKSMRLHEARLLLARHGQTIAEVANAVGYVSPSQFSREFKRHFGRTASEEVQWMKRHLGELPEADNSAG